MEPRRIAGWAFAAVSVAGGLIMDRLLPDTDVVNYSLLSCCVVVFLIGVALAFWPSRKAAERPALGDKYINNGANHGIMGPVTINGPKLFEPSDAQIAGYLQAIPAGAVVELEVVGDKSFPLADRFANALRARGVPFDEKTVHDLGGPLHGPVTSGPMPDGGWRLTLKADY
ncbi:MAG: hypothetical protein ACK4Z5_10290 [Brevundimonas sp.]